MLPSAQGGSRSEVLYRSLIRRDQHSCSDTSRLGNQRPMQNSIEIETERFKPGIQKRRIADPSM